MTTTLELALSLLGITLVVLLILQLVFHRRTRLEHDAALSQIEQSLALASSAGNLGLWRWDVGRGEIWASERCRELLGIAPATSLTRDALFAVIHPNFDETGIPEERKQGELRLAGPTGPARTVLLSERVHRNGRGEALSVTGVVLDYTEHRGFESEILKQRQQLAHLTRVAILGELSGALAHELNQPLTAILSNAQAALHLLARDHVEPHELREILKDIVSDDKRAGEVIWRLRGLLTRGETQLQRLDMTELVHDVLKIARGDLIARNVQLILRLDKSLPPVLADRVEMQQVLLNLILNACESMASSAAQERRIEIAATAGLDHGALRVSVRDWGRGIDPGQIEHVFDPFFTTKETGLGLGLSICRSIITAHKGRLWASTDGAPGAAFHFTVPLFGEERNHEFPVIQHLRARR
jgi:signal transduction histidine kinase